MPENGNMRILVTIRNNYGQEAIYPVCEKAKLFAALAGTSTLTRRAVDRIKRLGYAVEVCRTHVESL